MTTSHSIANILRCSERHARRLIQNKDPRAMRLLRGEPTRNVSPRPKVIPPEGLVERFSMLAGGYYVAGKDAHDALKLTLDELIRKDELEGVKDGEDSNEALTGEIDRAFMALAESSVWVEELVCRANRMRIAVGLDPMPGVDSDKPSTQQKRIDAHYRKSDKALLKQLNQEVKQAECRIPAEATGN
jgi:hypothetical protein